MKNWFRAFMAACGIVSIAVILCSLDYHANEKKTVSKTEKEKSTVIVQLPSADLLPSVSLKLEVIEAGFTIPFSYAVKTSFPQAQNTLINYFEILYQYHISPQAP